VGFLSRLVGKTRRYAGTPDPTDAFWYAPSGWAAAFSQAGIRVTPELAMTVSAVWFGTLFKARNLASMPCGILQFTGANAKQPAPDHPLASVVGLSPNQTQDAFQWIEQGSGHLTLRGNWYNKIVSGARGFADQLIPQHPDLVHVGRLANGRLQYTIRNLRGDPPEILTQDEMFHVRGYSTDGMTGLSMISYGANSLGVAIAQETYTGRFFKQGASAALAVKHPGVLGEEGSKNLRHSINAFLTGLENVGGVLVLEEGATLDKIGISPQDAQLLGMKDHSIREVARWMGLPSYLFSDLGKPPTYASSVQFAEDLVRYSFRPDARRIEMAIRHQLILQPMRYAAEFDMSELLKGDIAARYAAYHMAILDGWQNRNEVRIKENLNPEDGLDKFWQPLNMEDANAPPPLAPSPALPPADPADGPDARRYATRDVRATILAIEAAERVVRKEVAQVTKGAKDHANDPAAWSAWLHTYYADHAAYVAETLHLPLSLAREYAARQGLRLESVGVSVLEDFEATAAPELATWALDGPKREKEIR
jgi:HK97 family phage portal protein